MTQGETARSPRHGTADVPDGAWLGFHRRGHRDAAPFETALPQLLARGTLMAEFTPAREEHGPLTLVHQAAQDGWPRQFALTLTADERIVLHQRQGQTHAELSLTTAGLISKGGRIRLNYHWDAPARLSQLTLEALDNGAVRQATGQCPLPLPRADIQTLLREGGDAHVGSLDWLAIARGNVPVGPGAAFAPSTPIETPQGPRPAASIHAGDWVQTADSGPQQVLWSDRICLPALGALAPIRLSARYFGHTQDLWVLPHTRVVVSGAAVEYLFGLENVLVEARHLVDDISAASAEHERALGWQGILLRGHHLLIADGVHIESLFAGGLAAAPEIAATTAFARLSATGQLPRHKRSVLRELCAYEAASLRASRVRARAPLAA
jgi:hypothetical protein